MFPLVLPGIVTLAASQIGFTKGVLVCDLDGHVMQPIISIRLQDNYR
jgi:hypothetical protein